MTDKSYAQARPEAMLEDRKREVRSKSRKARGSNNYPPEEFTGYKPPTKEQWAAAKVTVIMNQRIIGKTIFNMCASDQQRATTDAMVRHCNCSGQIIYDPHVSGEMPEWVKAYIYSCTNHKTEADRKSAITLGRVWKWYTEEGRILYLLPINLEPGDIVSDDIVAGCIDNLVENILEDGIKSIGIEAFGGGVVHQLFEQKLGQLDLDGFRVFFYGY